MMDETQQDDTRETAIKALNTAIIACQRAGIDIGVQKYYFNGRQGVAIIIIGASIKRKRLILAVNNERT